MSKSVLSAVLIRVEIVPIDSKLMHHDAHMVL